MPGVSADTEDKEVNTGITLQQLKATRHTVRMREGIYGMC